jgi:bis(5'-nucleosyl)-tetraphosphatase (symmetrical)
VPHYAIGDIQGCMESLSALLARIGYRSGKDRLWLTGDLVNRGPRSLDVLRWARAAGDDVACVLGNHDVHLLARAAGVAKAKKRDTLDEVLAAPDLGDLVEWLARRPLVHEEAGRLLVHAGVAPGWTLAEVRRRARAVERLLAGPERAKVLAKEGGEARQSLEAFTRLRVAKPDGQMLFEFDGPPDAAPAGAAPWWDLVDASLPPIVCGHWSRAGLVMKERVWAIDTGCVWDGALTAVRIEDGKVVQVSCH